MNGLREVESIYTSTAVMIGRKQMANVEKKQRILDRLMLRLDAVMKLPPINTSCSTSPRNIWNRWLTSSVV